MSLAVECYTFQVSIYNRAYGRHLSAFGFSNGINNGRFSGNNKNGQVVYEIWRRQGDTGGWVLHATTKKQSFTDTPVTPGQYYEYKIRAVAATNASNFSNSAVVCGVL